MKAFAGFLLVLSPLAAHANYACQPLDGASQALSLNDSDPSHIEVVVDRQVYTAAVVNDQHGPFSSTTYELSDANGVKGTFVVTSVPHYTRGGGSYCGRAVECKPRLPPVEKTVSGSLNLNGAQPIEFTCEEAD